MKLLVITMALLAVGVLCVRVCKRKRPLSPVRRLASHLKTRADYKVFVGMPLDTPSQWAEASAYSAIDVTVELERIPLQGIQSYLIVYPNGQVLDTAGLFHPLPPGLKFLERRQASRKDTLNLSTLENGRRLAEVAFGPCTRRRGARKWYSTTLRNTGTVAFRVERFGAFSRASGEYLLNTVSGHYFSAAEFVAWYGAPVDGWILPGEAATDGNNYGGGDSYWVYFCVTRDGEEFVVGGEASAGR